MYELRDYLGFTEREAEIFLNTDPHDRLEGDVTYNGPTRSFPDRNDPFANLPDCEYEYCEGCEQEILLPIRAPAMRWQILKDEGWADDPLACPECQCEVEGGW